MTTNSHSQTISLGLTFGHFNHSSSNNTHIANKSVVKFYLKYGCISLKFLYVRKKNFMENKRTIIILNHILSIKTSITSQMCRHF